MFLKSLYLRNFRNYQEAQISFCEKINVFCGDNGQGKTNLLEAIYLIATGRSFRTQFLSELIYDGAPFFFLEAEMEKDFVSQKIKISFDGKNRRLQCDASTYSSFTPLLGMLPSVLYTPRDVDLITGAPAERRRFLNLHLAQSDPLYIHHFTRFWKAMKQRNCLLRENQMQSLDCWEVEMGDSAGYIQKARKKMVEELKEPLERQSRLLAGGETHEIQLRSSASENYIQQLQKNRLKEMRFGLTLTGPHRDDVTFLIDGKSAKLFASEGQKKTAVTALKLAEWELLSKRTKTSALIGFDDLSGSLDEKREKQLRSALDHLGQVFITTPRPQEGYLIHIQNGKLFQEL